MTDNQLQHKYLEIQKGNNLQRFDLTLMFGAGNEPTEEEFKKMLPADYIEVKL